MQWTSNFVLFKGTTLLILYSFCNSNPFFSFQVSSVQNQETQWQKIHVNTVPRAGGSCESPPWDLESKGRPSIHNRRASASRPWLSGSAGAWSCSIQRRTELPTRMCNLRARGVTRGRGHRAMSLLCIQSWPFHLPRHMSLPTTFNSPQGPISLETLWKRDTRSFPTENNAQKWRSPLPPVHEQPQKAQ